MPASSRKDYAHWQAAFTRTGSGERVELDGVFRLVFADHVDGRPRCTTFEEWWRRRTASAPA